MMEQKQLERLGSLFEKVVDNKATLIEQKELKNLYQSYINDGREKYFDRVPTPIYRRA